MTTYLLDTNACIALINGSPGHVRQRMRDATSGDAVVLLSSIVVFELWYGVGRSQQRERNAQRLNAFLAGPVHWTYFDDDDAREAGTVRTELEAEGKPIGAWDVLIAGQARRLGATLVTSNVSEFDRVSGLMWEDWSRPA